MRVDLSAYQDGGPSVGPVQRSLILKSLPGFSHLSGAELATLASVVRERVFRRGEEILTPGQPVVSLFLMVEGTAEMFMDGVSIGMFGARTSVGGIAALSRDPRGAHAVARTDVFALEVDADDMDELFEENANILFGVIGALSRTLRDLQEKEGGAAMRGRDFPDFPIHGNLTLVDKMFILRGTTNFKDASIEALAELAEGSIETSFEAGQRIWRKGAGADHSLMIVSGRVEARPENLEAISFGSRWVVGGLDSLADLTRWYDLYADTEVVAMILKRSVLYDVLEDYPDVGLLLLRGLARGALGLQQRQVLRHNGPRSSHRPKRA